MGLLDDAIREHLELKRRTGADPGDVERQEREALGPVVRGDELVADVTGGGAEGFPSEYEPVGADADLEHDYGYADDSLQVTPEPEPLYEQPPPVSEPEPHEQHEPAPAPPEPTAVPLSQHAGQPTEEFDVESHQAQEAAVSERPAAPEKKQGKEGEHDVLEETPDFLEETPEHDRLWFEQAPPQDFDFDK